LGDHNLSRIESNVFLIRNLHELNCNYWLYKVRGLSPDLEESQRNIQILTRKLTKISKSTCAQIRIGDSFYIAQPEGGEPLPPNFDLVRVSVKLERSPDLKILQFNQLDDTTAILALRFLYGSIQSRFWNNHLLWQPSAGHPFYDKYPDSSYRDPSSEIDLYRGFTCRVIILSNKEIGICIDVGTKYVSRHSLPTIITTQDISKFKGINCLYEYGNRWYEIKIQGLNDLNASELVLPNGNTLFEEVHSKSGKNKSPLLRALPKDCAVLYYYGSDGEIRNVPSGLCRRTYRTNHPYVKRHHRFSIKAPHIRRRDINYIVNNYFNNLLFNGHRIKLAAPFSYPEKTFTIPDLEFGNGKILSVRNTPGTINSEISRFPTMKKVLLYSPDAGIYTREMFDKQFVIMPKSVLDTYGPIVVDDIKKEANQLFLNDPQIRFEPTVIPYDDSVQKSVARLGRQIINAIEEFKVDYGYGLVMIPNMPSKRMMKEDELANLVMRELRKRDIYVSIMHTKTSSESFEFSDEGRDSAWRLIPENKIKGRYRGYISNIVLNKILLLNEFWPFVLGTKLTADLVIGIDVKKNTAGFTTVHKSGGKLSFEYSETEQKEHLGKDHIRNIIQKIIAKEHQRAKVSIKNIVIHRQGTLFETELKGINEALRILSKQGLVAEGYSCSFVEVRTTSRIPFRMFRISERLGRHEDWVDNPAIGTYKIISKNEAFICNTGPPFEYQGTTKPLHILKEGPMPIENVLEDIFYLACLTWTKIDDCSRLPISIKMGDIRLREFAGDYDADALRFEEENEDE
jgi:hypothetical protein